MMGERSTRILSIDGGGIKGLVVLKQLEFFEHTLKKPLYKYFDTITGTSTGGIIAVLLSLGYSVKSIREFYEIHGENIFDKRPLRFGLLRPKYSDEYFNDILKTHLKDYRLSDCKTNIVIPAYNITKNRLDIFTKTDVDSVTQKNNTKLFDIVRSTASAPSYFKAHQIGEDYYVDGGLLVNNPTEIAYLEAIKQGNNTFQILTFSTGTKRVKNKKRLLNGGKLQWAIPLVNIMLSEQSKMVDYRMKRQFELSTNIFNKRLGLYIRCESITNHSSGDIDDASKDNMKNLLLDGELSTEKNKDLIRTFYYNTL